MTADSKQAVMQESAKFFLQGELSFSTVGSMQVEPYLPENIAVELDLSEVTEIDSAGVAWLIDWLRRAKEKGSTPRCIGMNAQLRNLLQVYEIDFIGGEIGSG